MTPYRKNVYISEANNLLITTKEYKNGRIDGDELCPQGAERVEWTKKESENEKDMVKIGTAIKTKKGYLLFPIEKENA